jgi:hypothetical protein
MTHSRRLDQYDLSVRVGRELREVLGVTTVDEVPQYSARDLLRIYPELWENR